MTDMTPEQAAGKAGEEICRGIFTGTIGKTSPLGIDQVKRVILGWMEPVITQQREQAVADLKRLDVDGICYACRTYYYNRLAEEALEADTPPTLNRIARFVKQRIDYLTNQLHKEESTPCNGFQCKQNKANKEAGLIGYATCYSCIWRGDSIQKLREELKALTDEDRRLVEVLAGE